MQASHLSFQERASYCLSPVAKKLLTLMDDKKTNLALSADVNTASELLTLAEQIGPYICLLKTHIDIIKDFTPALTLKLREIANEHHFLIFEDRKFADIGHTVMQQYADGMYRIAEWADIVNAHSLPGPSILRGLAEIGRKKNRAILLIAELSSEGNLLNEDYVQATLNMAEKFSDIVIGFITQQALSTDPHWIYFTPGIQLLAGGDHLGQQYKTPEKAILENGSDVIIVGRGIIKANDPKAEAKKYRDLAFGYYLKRCKKS